MKTVLIFHGTCDKEEYYSDAYPSLSNSHWFPWLQKQLLIRGFAVHTPEVFEAYEPTYDKWLEELSRYKINSKTILIGHSAGGGFLVRWPSENKNVQVSRVILIAPWLNVDNADRTDMFNFVLEPNFAERTGGVIVFYSDNDMDMISRSVDKLKKDTKNLEFIKMKNYGHFTQNDMESVEFPELLERCLE